MAYMVNQVSDFLRLLHPHGHVFGKPASHHGPLVALGLFLLIHYIFKKKKTFLTFIFRKLPTIWMQDFSMKSLKEPPKFELIVNCENKPNV